MDTSQLPLPKGRTRKQIKAKKDRAEATVKKSVRAACVKRDRYCRVGLWTAGLKHPPVWLGTCAGPAEWAHLHSHRRAQTRGQAAEKRHTTAGSLCLCRFHHAEYDAHRMKITALTRRGADGPLRFSRKAH